MWTRLPDMNVARSGHACQLLPGAKILAAWGTNDSGTVDVSSESPLKVGCNGLILGDYIIYVSGHTCCLLAVPFQCQAAQIVTFCDKKHNLVTI